MKVEVAVLMVSMDVRNTELEPVFRLNGFADVNKNTFDCYRFSLEFLSSNLPVLATDSIIISRHRRRPLAGVA